MNFLDMIKNSVLERFDGTLSVWQVVLGLMFSLAAGVFILYVYRRTMKKVAVGRSFMVSLLLMCAITTMMVLTITSNLALSLGMVGALSIVRFRTAVKDPADTAFLFWAVAAGITAGAGFYLLTLGGCVVVGLICIFSTRYMDKADKPFLLVVRADAQQALQAVEEKLTEYKVSFSLSSCVDTGSYSEAIYEVGVTEAGRSKVAALKEIPGITTVSLVDCRKEA